MKRIIAASTAELGSRAREMSAKDKESKGGGWEREEVIGMDRETDRMRANVRVRKGGQFRPPGRNSRQTLPSHFLSGTVGESPHLRNDKYALFHMRPRRQREKPSPSPTPVHPQTCPDQSVQSEPAAAVVPASRVAAGGAVQSGSG